MGWKISWIGYLPYMQVVSRGKIILKNKEFDWIQ